MLRNRFYLGVKVYQQNGESQEAEAVWPAILDRDLFDKVNEQLDKNYRRNKDNMVDRFPFLLTGLCICKTCGDRMVGKSAHGQAGKIPYYEHGLSTRKFLASTVVWGAIEISLWFSDGFKEPIAFPSGFFRSSLGARRVS